MGTELLHRELTTNKQCAGRPELPSQTPAAMQRSDRKHASKTKQWVTTWHRRQQRRQQQPKDEAAGRAEALKECVYATPCRGGGGDGPRSILGNKKKKNEAKSSCLAKCVATETRRRSLAAELGLVSSLRRVPETVDCKKTIKFSFAFLKFLDTVPL